MRVLLAVALVAAFFVSGCGEPDRVARTDAQVKQATVKLAVYGSDGTEQGHGTGFFIAPGVVATAKHVADAPDNLTAVFVDGHRAETALLWEADDRDVALLSASEAGAWRMALDCALPEAGREVATIGHPKHWSWVRTEGRVAMDGAGENGWLLMQLNILPGNSGGAVYDRETGRAVGIVSSVYLSRVAAPWPARAISDYALIEPVAPWCDAWREIAGTDAPASARLQIARGGR